MSSFELNKVIGAILGIFLIILIINNLGNIIFKQEDNKEHSAENNEKLYNNTENSIIKSDTNILNIEERLVSANIKKGEAYTKKCSVCHSFKNDGKNKLGPNLYNIYGRKIASIKNFAYSKALKNLKSNWDIVNLDNFLLNPKKWAPGTKMVFIGIKNDQERAQVIKYLQSLN